MDGMTCMEWMDQKRALKSLEARLRVRIFPLCTITHPAPVTSSPLW